MSLPQGGKIVNHGDAQATGEKSVFYS